METLLTSTSGDIAGLAFGMLAMTISIAGGRAYFRGASYYGFVLSILACLAVSTYSTLGTSLSLEATKTDTYDFYYAAQQFYLGGVEAEALSVGPNVYAYIWSWFFAVFGPSPFLTNNLGILSFSVGCIVIAKIYAELNGKLASMVPLLFLVLSPATIFHASLSWREPHQILALALATLYGLRYMQRGSMSALALSLIFLVAGSLIHNKIILFNFAFALVLFVCGTLGRSWRPEFKRGRLTFGVVIAPIALVAALVASYYFALSDEGMVARVLTQGGAQESLQEWRSAAGGRTKFLWDMEFDSIWSMMTSFPLVLLQFLVAPLIPLQPESALDIAAAVDGSVRVILLLLIAKRLATARGGEWWDICFLVVAYLAYCAIVALGTGNAGTALRHQIKASWLLILVSGPVLMALLSGRRSQRGAGGAR